MSLTNSSTLHRPDAAHLIKSPHSHHSLSRHSLRHPDRNDYHGAATLRQRTFSASEEGSEDTLAELRSPPPTPVPVQTTKLQPTPVDRRYSSPHIPLSSLVSKAFQKKSSLTPKTKYVSIDKGITSFAYQEGRGKRYSF